MCIALNELLFYGGMAVAGISLLGLMVYGGITQIRKVQLCTLLDVEYGEQTKR